MCDEKVNSDQYIYILEQCFNRFIEKYLKEDTLETIYSNKAMEIVRGNWIIPQNTTIRVNHE